MGYDNIQFEMFGIIVKPDKFRKAFKKASKDAEKTKKHFDKVFEEIKVDKKKNVNHTLSNSIDSNYSADVQEKKKSQRERVLETIQLIQPCCDTEIHIFSEVRLNQVPDRRGKLLKEGKIYLAFNDVNPATGKRVAYYRAKKGIK